MNLVFLYPGISGTKWNSLGTNMDNGWISHGLASLSAQVKKHTDWNVSLIDLRTLSGWREYIQEIKIRKPDVLAVTMMSCDFTYAMTAMAVAKSISPQGFITIVGGCHPSIETDECLKEPVIDYVMTGEGEEIFVWFLNKISSGQRGEIKRLIKGSCPNLDEIEYADRSLFLDEWKDRGIEVSSPEVPFPGFSAPFSTVIAGRGCKYNCSFCSPAEEKVFGKRVRRRSPQSVMGELFEIKERYGLGSFLIHDDCLTEDIEWITCFASLYKDSSLNAPFLCQSRADIIVNNKNAIEALASAGLQGVLIGFESGSNRVLKFMRKGTTREQNIEAAKICKSLGIKIWANYFFGCPTETREEAEETISMLREIQPDYYSPAIYTPAPGSDLYEYCKINDLIQITSHDGFRRNVGGRPLRGVDYDWYYSVAVPESMKK
jgi:radical SAM superfamily enzyme YgiQ (UPF0313 family)